MRLLTREELSMNIKIRLTEEEENMILSVEEAERDHKAMTRALSKIIEGSDLDANSFNMLKKEYRFLDDHDGKMRVFRCSPKCIDIVYKMMINFGCPSQEMVIRAILYHHNKKITGNNDDYLAVG